MTGCDSPSNRREDSQMRFNRLAQWIGCAVLGFAAQACVVRDNTPVNSGYGYGYGPQASYQASVSVGTPSPYYVSSMPPEPLYEAMTASPGYGYVWIDGYWHWNGYEWTWVSGRRERQQEGYVYVQPYYDYTGGQYVYTPGYWSRPDRVPSGWQVRDHRDGRPPIVAPPAGWHTPPPQGGWHPQPQPTRPGATTVGGPVMQPQPTGGRDVNYRPGPTLPPEPPQGPNINIGRDVNYRPGPTMQPAQPQQPSNNGRDINYRPGPPMQPQPAPPQPPANNGRDVNYRPGPPMQPPARPAAPPRQVPPAANERGPEMSPAHPAPPPRRGR